MVDDPRGNREHGGPLEAANLGIARPPLVYLVSILLGVALHFSWPLPLLPGSPSAGFGAGLILLAGGLFLFAVRTFRAAGTPVPGNRPTTTIVRAGPYRFTRNPIYLAFSLFQLGIAIWINSLWLLVTFLGAVGLIHCVVIRREERYLERRFGAEYLNYKGSVRRWL